MTFLSHGSFGACPKVVQDAQQELRCQIDRQPVRFFSRESMALWDAARARVAALVRARPEDLGFVANATIGVNIAWRSFPLRPRDEVLVFPWNGQWRLRISGHAYNCLQDHEVLAQALSRHSGPCRFSLCQRLVWDQSSVVAVALRVLSRPHEVDRPNPLAHRRDEFSFRAAWW